MGTLFVINHSTSTGTYLCCFDISEINLNENINSVSMECEI